MNKEELIFKWIQKSLILSQHILFAEPLKLGQLLRLTSLIGKSKLLNDFLLEIREKL
jgi:hypothetical protein